ERGPPEEGIPKGGASSARIDAGLRQEPASAPSISARDGLSSREMPKRDNDPTGLQKIQAGRTFMSVACPVLSLSSASAKGAPHESDGGVDDMRLRHGWLERTSLSTSAKWLSSGSAIASGATVGNRWKPCSTCRRQRGRWDSRYWPMLRNGLYS